MSCKITPKTVVVSSGALPQRQLEDEIVALDLEGDRYLGFNAVGGRVWELIQRPIAVRDVTEAILREYDVEREPLAEDLTRFLVRLIDLELARVECEDSEHREAVSRP